jgi:hypothetical protein
LRGENTSVDISLRQLIYILLLTVSIFVGWHHSTDVIATLERAGLYMQHRHPA